MSTLLRWWLYLCLSTVGILIAYVFGFFSYMVNVDKSYLGFVVLTTYAFTTGWIGLLTYHARNRDQLFTRHLHTVRWISDTMMALGICGTLVGYLLIANLMGSAGNVIADPSAAQKFVQTLAYGLGTSSIVTLVGLIGSIGLKVQIVNLEYQLDENDAQ